jgi:hypothetical protein
MNIINEIEGLVEVEYFTEIVKNIQGMDEYNFLFVQWYNEIQTNLKNKTIVFIISDESYSMPGDKFLKPNVEMIFKNYHPFNETNQKVRPLPLGFVGGFRGNNDIPIQDREFDYSFTGAWNQRRHGLLEAFKKRETDGREKFFHMNRNWCGGDDAGLSIAEYSSLMSNTKISLCPPGYENNESFRIFESAMCGNIIVSETPCPYWYYKDMPHFTIESWDNLNIVDNIMSKSDDELSDISNKTRQWYDDNISPKSIARYIEKEVCENTTKINR